MPEFRGAVLDDSGSAINDADVELYDADTTTPVRATTTTDASGLWSISHSTRGRFDVKVINGTDVVWLRVRDRFQVDKVQAESASDGPIVGTQAEDANSVQVAILEGDRATPADGDLAYLTLRLSDSAGNQDEQARIGWSATTVASGATQDGDLILYALTNGTLTEYLRLDGSVGAVDVSGDFLVGNGNGVVIGHSSQITAGATGELQVLGTGTDDSAAILGRWSADASPARIQFIKSRNATIGSSTVIQDSDDLGHITWYADDGSDFASIGARISAEIDGSPGSNDTPGAVIISTTADGAATPTEAARFNSSQNMVMSGDIVPEADGTRDLGVQTTAQWANVWADLINGSDIGFENGWRAVEADTYQGYGPGIAFDFGTHFKTGKALAIKRVKTGTREKVIGKDEDGNPVTKTVDVFSRERVSDVQETPKFVVTEDFIEYQGRRITPAVLDSLLALV